MLPGCMWTLCSNCTDLLGELRTGSSDRSRRVSIFSFWASWPVKTGLTESPGVIKSPDMTGKTRCTWCDHSNRFTRSGRWNRLPDTGYRYRVPVIKPEPGPGITGTCSESSGQVTDDCWTDPFIANRAFEPVSQKEDRSTRYIDSDRGDLSFDSITWSDSPGMDWVQGPGTGSRVPGPGTGH